MRLVIDSDVGNEIDDFYAIALALAPPDRFDVRGISAAHYNNARPNGKMTRVHDIENDAAWNILFETLRRLS